MNFKAVLFDLDGTLVDSLPLILESFRAALKQVNLSFSDEEILKTVGLPLRDICARFAGDRGQELFKCYLEYQDKIHDSYLKEYPGTMEALVNIKNRSFRLGIVTSKRRVMAERGIKLTGLDKIIEVLVALEDAPRAKPEAEPVLKALEALEVEPPHAVYVGDSPFDIRCGKKAGVQTVGVTWGISSREQLEREEPNAIIDNWQQLLDFLETSKGNPHL